MMETVCDSSTANNNNSSNNGNTSLDTGVSSDLSESRPSLGSDRYGELSDSEESGVEFYVKRRATDGADEQEAQKRKRKREEEEQEEERLQRRRQDDDYDDDEIDADEDEEEEEDEEGLTADKMASLKSGHVTFGAVPVAAGTPSTAAAAAAAVALSYALSWPGRAGFDKGDANAPGSILARDAAAAAVAAAKLNDDMKEVEYKNEEDDPFSAVLREMKLKGEFPCRLCDAVFPNLRALKG